MKIGIDRFCSVTPGTPSFATAPQACGCRSTAYQSKARAKLLVRLSARLTREQASDVVFHLRCLIDDVSAEAGLDRYERMARDELLAACHVFRKERTDPHDMEDAKARLHSVAFLLSAVESYLEAAR